MMPVILLVAAAAVTAVAAIFAAVSRLKEQTGAVEQIAREVMLRLQNVEGRLDQTERAISENMGAMRKELRDEARAAREEQSANITSLGDVQAKRIKEIGDLQRESLESFSQQLSNVSRLNEEKLEAMRGTIGEKILEMQKGNEEKLEKMRATVDEKLHSTLEKRLSEAFTSVSDRLKQVHEGLGEMKTLASEFGDFKKVITNVKTRGAWGEMQLGSLLDQILTKEQYAEKVTIKQGTQEQVEFAIKLPGPKDNGEPVWLPIDSKFPIEDYNRLLTASENSDADGVAAARKALRTRVKEEAKKIRSKYIEPPRTTDFAILFLPTEGLYAEVVQIEGLCDEMSRECRVIPAGPTTISALLNSLQMGFRTLAIEKRSSEVWKLLGTVKTEFEKFGEILERTKKKIDQAGEELGKAERKTRTITRKLGDVQSLPVGDEEEEPLTLSCGDEEEE